MNKHEDPLTPEQIAAVPDSAIDFSEVPELDEDFWREADLIPPDRTEPTQRGPHPNEHRAPSGG
ncbi:MAG: hypothetical protein OXC12_19565 [Spirochaetaceae bacterium]|nr:hypothetical protein [Spirochaetaceae bacterium]